MIRILRILANMCIGSSLFVCGCGSNEQPEDDAIENLLLAQELIEQGDHVAALDKLNTSIEQRPDAWTYFERAQLYAKSGEDEKAKTDIKSGLALDEKNSKLIWLKKELKKPKGSRFKKSAPSGKPG